MLAARGQIKELESVEFINLYPFWFLIKNHGMALENEIMLSQSFIIASDNKETKTKSMSNLRKMIYPDEKSPFQEMLDKYRDSAMNESGQVMQVRMQKD